MCSMNFGADYTFEEALSQLAESPARLPNMSQQIACHRGALPPRVLPKIYNWNSVTLLSRGVLHTLYTNSVFNTPVCEVHWFIFKILETKQQMFGFEIGFRSLYALFSFWRILMFLKCKHITGFITVRDSCSFTKSL